MRVCLLTILSIFFQEVFGQDSQNKKLPDSILIFKARMVDNSTLTPDCGYIAFAVAKKFEVIECNDPELMDKHVTFIIQCPELYGKGFFVNRKVYSVVAGLNNDASFGWIIRPSDYVNRKTRVFWARKIMISKE